MTAPDRRQQAEAAARQAARAHGVDPRFAESLPAMVSAAVEACLPEVRVLRLQPDDVVVAAVNKRMTTAETAVMDARLKAGFPDHRVLITGHVDLSVVRPEVADQIEEGTPS